MKNSVDEIALKDREISNLKRTLFALVDSIEECIPWYYDKRIADRLASLIGNQKDKEEEKFE